MIKASQASVNLQDLIDHTVRRLMEFIQYDVYAESVKLTLIFKWGADGSGNHSRFDPNKITLNPFFNK